MSSRRRSDESIAEPVAGADVVDDSLGGLVEEPPPGPLEGFVRVRHLDTRGEGDVPIAALGLYRARRWRTLDEFDAALELELEAAAEATVEADETTTATE